MEISTRGAILILLTICCYVYLADIFSKPMVQKVRLFIQLFFESFNIALYIRYWLIASQMGQIIHWQI